MCQQTAIGREKVTCVSRLQWLEEQFHVSAASIERGKVTCVSRT